MTATLTNGERAIVTRHQLPPNPPGAGYLPAGDNVKQALARAGATDPQIDSVLWLLTYGRQEKVSSTSALARRLNVSASTLGRVFAADYGAELTNIISKIDHFRKLATERREFGDHVVVTDLRVVEDITSLCELTRVSQTMAMLFGPNQSGKSWALKKIYAPAHNHGRTVYVSLLESGGATRLFLQDLLVACGISDRKAYGEMKQRLFRYFDPQTLLIVDEFHQTMIGRTLKMTTIEAIRAIHEKCGCGVVLCGTDILPDMFNDPRYHKFLGQTANRGVLRRLIPAKPYPEDVTALLKAHGLSRAPEGDAKKIVDGITGNEGIGKLCKYLKMSRRLASKRRVPVDWNHFLETHATLKSWERGEQMVRAKMSGGQ